MELMLFRPTVAAIDCEDCRKRLYDLETGKPKIYRAGPKREIRYFDDATHKPPCEQSGMECAKGHWSKAKQFELTEANLRTWQLFQQVKATSGRVLTDDEARDDIVRHNLATLESIYSQWQTTTTANEIARLMAVGPVTDGRRTRNPIHAQHRNGPSGRPTAKEAGG